MTSYTTGAYPPYRLRPLAIAAEKTRQALRWLSRQAATSDQDQQAKPPHSEQPSAPNSTVADQPQSGQPHSGRSTGRLTPIRPRRLPSAPDGHAKAPRPGPSSVGVAPRPLPKPRPVRPTTTPPVNPPSSQAPAEAPPVPQAPATENSDAVASASNVFDETRSLPKIDHEPGLDHEPDDQSDLVAVGPETPIDPQIQEWVRQAQAGDNEAFGRLYDTYVNMVFRYVYYRIGNKALAEDFTSETFLRALRRIGTFTWTGRDIGAWFVTIARNILRDHVKSSRFRMEQSSAEILETDQVSDGPEREVLDNMAHSQLWTTVKKLNADQQECIVLRFIQGLSVAETAKIMGRNEGAIKALQHRAVRRLGKLLPDGLR